MRLKPCSAFESTGAFASAFYRLVPDGLVDQVWEQIGPKPRGQKPRLSGSKLVEGLICHVLAGAGTLATHVKEHTGIKVSDSDLSQRRMAAGVAPFEAIAQAALRPLAEPGKHPEAFYKGWRLMGMDGSQFSVSNTPRMMERLSKAMSRRLKAAFAKVPMSWMMELGTHAPVAAVVGIEQESEWQLSKGLLSQMQGGWLLLCDRLYGVAAFANELLIRGQTVGSHFLARVRENVKIKVREILPDGSALVDVPVADPRNHHHKQGAIRVREITGRVRRKNGKWVVVRFWTSLLDAREYPAMELLALYAQRWEIELGTGELKRNVRGAHLLQSHTPETAAQEILAALIGMAIISQSRLDVCQTSQMPPPRISFTKTLQAVSALWKVLDTGRDLLTPYQVIELTARTLIQIAEQATSKRRQRSCPRAVRQSVKSWPRLTANTYEKGPIEYEIQPTMPV